MANVTMDAQQTLDAYFADQLGCTASDLRRREVVLVSSPSGPKAFPGYGSARGHLFPQPLWAVQTADGVVISVLQGWRGRVEKTLDGVEDWHAALATERWVPLQALLQHQNPAMSFVRGFLLYCDRQGFTPCRLHEPILLPEEHPLRRTYGPEVPAVSAIVIGDRVVSHAHIKPPRSDAVWEIAVGTDPEHRRKGYARAVVSAATQFVLATGRVALYACDEACDEGIHPSLAVARRLGYTEYGRYLLCFETWREAEGSG
jgi:GNAT superfamily N-acetyltransferase